MEINSQKIQNAILFFANKNGNTIERMRLMKLLWLSDRLHLNKYGRLILKDRYKALPNGPIPSQSMNISNVGVPGVIEIDKFNIIANKEFDETYFSKSDITIMNYVWERFKNVDSFRFSDYSHKFPEWLRFKNELESQFTPNAYDLVIQDFFEFHDMEEFSDLLDEETINLSKQDFNVRNAIQSSLN